ncbi:MAG: CTP synthetase [Roseobacter sp.]
MMRVIFMLYGIVATSLAGAAVVAVLVFGVSTVMPIVAAAATGAIVALPVSYFVASKIVSSS